MALPVITLVGQKNVGKSTLFNRLTCTNDALIANYPGLTRDRQYGYLHCELFKSILVDTGGIDKVYSSDIQGIQGYIYNQVVLAIKEADIILFLVDGRFKETVIDYNIINFLRKLEKNIFIVINKIDDVKNNKNSTVFYEYDRFGVKNYSIISAMHGYGVSCLLKKISFQIKQAVSCNHSQHCIEICNQDGVFEKNRLKRFLSVSSIGQKNFIVLAIAGRPNSGKSTFINSILGTNRMITCDTPGTTRDSVYTSIIYNGQQYILIDTAGIKKKNNFNNTTVVDQISIMKTFRVIKNAHVILFMIDADIGISEKDLSILRCIMNIGISLIIVINKWDNIPVIMRRAIKKSVYKQTNFITFIQVHFISALYKNGFKSLFQSIQVIFNRLINMRSVVNTSKLMRIMRMAITKRPPPCVHGRVKIQLKYIHVGGYNPLILVIHGIYVSKLSVDYQKYLKNFFYKNLNIKSTMLRIRLKDAANFFNNKKYRL